MTNTITYKELMRLVHPDINPNIDDHSGKFNKIKLYYKNEEMLYKFGVEWGVIDNISTPQPKIVRLSTKMVHPHQRWNANLFVPRKTMTDRVKRGDDILVKTLDIVATCVKVTPKRVYFRKSDGTQTFCSIKNAVKV